MAVCAQQCVHGFPDIPLRAQRLPVSLLTVQFVLHFLLYRGSHDLTYPLSCSAACFTLLPVLYLKTTSGSSLAEAPQTHHKENILWSNAMHLAWWIGRTDGRSVQQVMICDLCAFACTMGLGGWVMDITVSQSDCCSTATKMCGDRTERSSFSGVCTHFSL